MAIVYFDNFKFDNTTATIPSTKWGVFTAEGAKNLTNSYVKNGYSASGLDLSVTTDSSTRGSYYASKSGIQPVNTNNIQFTAGTLGRLGLGFSLDQYPVSGTSTMELGSLPVNYSDMTNVLTAYNFDGSIMLVAYKSVSTTSNMIDVYKRVAVGQDSGYTFMYNLLSTGSSTSTISKLKYSLDGQYFAYALSGTSSTVYIYKSAGGTSFTSVYTSAAITGTVPDLTFKYDNSLVVACNQTPFIAFYFKTLGSDAWTKTANPATLPTGAGRSVAAEASGAYIFVAAANGILAYIFNAATAPTYVASNSVTGITNVVSIDSIYSKDRYIVAGLSTTPYAAIYNVNSSMATVALPETLTAAVKSVVVNPTSSKFTFLFNGAIQPKMYKVSNATIKPYSNTYPALNYNQLVYSSDNNYVTLSSNTNIVRYDNMVNVVAVIAAGTYEGTTLADNYDYSSGPSRFSITMEDNCIGLRYFSSGTTSAVSSLMDISAEAAGFTNGIYSNVYVEILMNGTGTSSNNIAAYVGNRTAIIMYSGNATQTNYALSEWAPFFSGPISICFKRDVNTTSSTTINMHVSDLYVIDGSGAINTTSLGPCSVITEPLVSDGSVQWNTTGANNYGVLSDNPPNEASFVSSNVSGATDTININNASSANALATKVSAFAKISGPSSSNGLTLIDGSSKGLKNTLSTSYTQVEKYSDVTYTYVAASAASPTVPFYVTRTTNINGIGGIKSIPVNGAATANGGGLALTPDGKYLIGGYTNATATPYVNAFSYSNDSYNVIPTATFTEVGVAVDNIAITEDGKYIAIAASNNLIYFYRNNFDNSFTYLNSINASTRSTIMKFSKGGKYLFVNNTGSALSKVIKFTSSNESFAFITISGLTGVNMYAFDTMITTDGVEFIAFTTNSAPYVLMYKINNDDTFTAATTTAQGVLSSTPYGITFGNNGASTNTQYLTLSVPSSTTLYTEFYTIANNTLSAATALSGNTLPTLVTANNGTAYPKGPQLVAEYLSMSGANIFRQIGGISTGYPTSTTYGVVISASANIFRFSAVQVSENNTTIGYTYT